MTYPEEARRRYHPTTSLTVQPITFPLAQSHVIADRSGAFIWPEKKLVIVADLHFEKGSAFAGRGSLVPPYDTRSTLSRLARVLTRWSPDRVISLGDGFHDDEASHRLSDRDRERLRQLTARHDWIWITGNHDPLPPADVGGTAAEAVEIGGLVFRHIPSHDPQQGNVSGEIAGHLHPKASVLARGRRVCRPCFVADGRRAILPAFGSYTGGLSLCDPAVSCLFPGDYRAYLLGRDRIHMVGRRQIERHPA